MRTSKAGLLTFHLAGLLQMSRKNSAMETMQKHGDEIGHTRAIPSDSATV